MVKAILALGAVAGVAIGLIVPTPSVRLTSSHFINPSATAL